MSRQKKTRRLTDIMPARKSDKKPEQPLSGRKATRYELDAKAREEKKKRKDWIPVLVIVRRKIKQRIK